MIQNHEDHEDSELEWSSHFKMFLVQILTKYIVRAPQFQQAFMGPESAAPIFLVKLWGLTWSSRKIQEKRVSRFELLAMNIHSLKPNMFSTYFESVLWISWDFLFFLPHLTAAANAVLCFLAESAAAMFCSLSWSWSQNLKRMEFRWKKWHFPNLLMFVSVRYHITYFPCLFLRNHLDSWRSHEQFRINPDHLPWISKFPRCLKPRGWWQKDCSSFPGHIAKATLKLHALSEQ